MSRWQIWMIARRSTRACPNKSCTPSQSFAWVRDPPVSRLPPSSRRSSLKKEWLCASAGSSCSPKFRGPMILLTKYWTRSECNSFLRLSSSQAVQSPSTTTACWIAAATSTPGRNCSCTQESWPTASTKWRAKSSLINSVKSRTSILWLTRTSRRRPKSTKTSSLSGTSVSHKWMRPSQLFQWSNMRPRLPTTYLWEHSAGRNSRNCRLKFMSCSKYLSDHIPASLCSTAWSKSLTQSTRTAMISKRIRSGHSGTKTSIFREKRVRNWILHTRWNSLRVAGLARQYTLIRPET